MDEKKKRRRKRRTEYEVDGNIQITFMRYARFSRSERAREQHTNSHRETARELDRTHEVKDRVSNIQTHTEKQHVS